MQVCPEHLERQRPEYLFRSLLCGPFLPSFEVFNSFGSRLGRVRMQMHSDTTFGEWQLVIALAVGLLLPKVCEFDFYQNGEL